MGQNQYLNSIHDIVRTNVASFNANNVAVTERNTLPSNGVYQMNQWYKIPNVICVFVDMRASTKLSAATHAKSTARVYELFTGTAIKIFHELGAQYVDIKGDGVFALFNENEANRALAAGITFKTFAELEFKKLMDRIIPGLDIGFHIGIDQKTVLVKQVGIQDAQSRDSRKNEVWAGKPINMAAKLASKSMDNLWVSDRFYNNINSSLLNTHSCGCTQEGVYHGDKVGLWEEVELNDDIFDFRKAYILKSRWCISHGQEWCKQILTLD